MDGNEPAGPPNRPFDLEERTARFGEDVIALAKKITIDPVTERLVPQLVAAATSVGGNYGEAQEAESLKDFRHKLAVSKKESRESKHYLRMACAARPHLRDEIARLHREAHELNLILAASIRKVDARLPRPKPPSRPFDRPGSL